MNRITLYSCTCLAALAVMFVITWWWVIAIGGLVLTLALIGAVMEAEAEAERRSTPPWCSMDRRLWR